MIDSRRYALIYLLACGCSSGNAPSAAGVPNGSTGNDGSASSGEAPANAGSGPSAAGASPSTGGTGSLVGGGSGGTASGSGTAATGQSGAARNDPDSGGPETSSPQDGAPGAGCPAGALICDDFEGYAPGATDLTPNWLTYIYGGGMLQVDGTRAHAGAKALHLTTPVGGRKYADIIKQNPADKELLPLKHYGRVMVWVSAIPSAAHWNINHAVGPLANSANLVSSYRYGGQNGLLLPNYTQRIPLGDGLMPLRGGGLQDGDANTLKVDCGMNAATQKLPINQWVCWEWMFDGQNNQQRLWLDGVEQTEAALTGKPGQCGGWQGPKLWTKMILGWEVYTAPSDKAQEAWLDDLVVSDKPIGCPH
jgi:hypothetical protein